MENIQITMFLGSIVSVIVVAAFIIYFILRFYKKTTESLEQEKDDAVCLNTGFVNRISQLEHVLEMENVRNVLACELATMDDAGEKCSLDNIDQETWQCISGLYYSMYPIVFERDFQKLDSKASVQDLVQFDTKHLDLEHYLEQHPEFREKSLVIIKKGITDCKNYQQLESLFETLMQWSAVIVYKAEIVAMTQSQAHELSLEDLHTIRKKIAAFFNKPLMVGGLAEMRSLMTDVLEMVNRNLLSREACNDFKRMHYETVQYALRHIQKWSTGAEELEKTTKLLKQFEELYSKEVTKELEAA